MTERAHMLCTRASKDKVAMLKRLAKAMGLSQLDVVRQLIRKAVAELKTKH